MGLGFWGLVTANPKPKTPLPPSTALFRGPGGAEEKISGGKCCVGRGAARPGFVWP